MGYYDVSAVWNGAVEEEETVSDNGDALDVWLELRKKAAQFEASNGAEGAESSIVELFVVHHDHDITDEECSCIQYLTDHHPAVTLIGGVEMDPHHADLIRAMDRPADWDGSEPLT